jgi:hypothetical protein
MFVINEDNSIYATRGDIVFFSVRADDDGNPHHFQAGDVVRFKVYGKKDAENVVLQKDFPVTEVCEEVEIFLGEEDTKIGEVISKPKDYWYEVELNPFDHPQTIIGYDEDGAKVLKLFPEGDDINEYVPNPEDFPVVDEELDMTSTRPVQNQAIARAYQHLLDGYERTHAAVAEKFVTPQMFGAIGDGEADDTEAFQACFATGCDVVVPEGTYKVTDKLNISNDLHVSGHGKAVIDFAGDTLFNISSYYRTPFTLRNIQINANGNQVIKADNGSWGASFLFDNVLITGADDSCIEFVGAFNVRLKGVVIEGTETATGTIVKLGTSESSTRFSNLVYFESCMITANRNANLIEVGNCISAKAMNCTFQCFNCAVTGTMTLIGCWFEDGNECVPSNFDGLLVSPHFADIASIMSPGVSNADFHPDVKKTSTVIYSNSEQSVLERMFDTPVDAIESLYVGGYLNGAYAHDLIYKVRTNMILCNVPVNKCWVTSDSSLLGFRLDTYSNQHIGVFEVRIGYFRIVDGQIVQRCSWHGIVKDGEAIMLDSTDSMANYPAAISYNSSNAYLTFGNANGGTSMGWIEFNRLSY